VSERSESAPSSTRRGNDVKLSSSRRPDHSNGPSADHDRPVLFSVKGRFWRKAVVRRADDHAGSESLVDIAVVEEGEGAGLSARIVDHAAARPPRSRARSRRRAPVPGEHENGRHASSRARLVLRAIERQDVEGIRLDFVIVLARVQDIEIGNTVNPKDDSFAITELICSTPRATRRVFQTSQT
jgi:hypothetical protein